MMDREKALQIIWDRCQHSKETEKALDVLKEERPRGKWDKEKSGSAYLAVRKCLNCNNRSAVGNFCMWCGADMREGEVNAKDLNNR